MQISENISEYYDNEMNILKRVNTEAKIFNSTEVQNAYSGTLDDYYIISKSIKRVKSKILININAVLL